MPICSFELKNVHFYYKRNNVLFHNLNLHLQPGRIYGLLGKNGAGKTTLLKLMAGLLFPKKGECLLEGKKSSQRLPEVLENFFIVPEEFSLPPFTVSEFTRLKGSFYPGFDKDKFKSHLQEFELTQHGKLAGLSFGQKKKFLIAFGLATGARNIILDEPTNGLDIPSKSQFRKILISAMEDEKTIVISTHQVRDLEQLIESVVVLDKGQIIFKEDISIISDRLIFSDHITDEVTTEIAYMEEIQGRKSGILLNNSGVEQRVDLEMLFNVLMKDANSINRLF